MLTETDGIIRAALFGGSRSKLKGLVTPWQTGTVWLYSDPVRSSHKITDFSVTVSRSAIRENLVRSWAASLCSELVTKSHGTADWKLANAFLDGLDISGEDDCRRGMLRFLWRFLETAGIQPEIDLCCRCLASGGAIPGNGLLYYSPHEEACLCVSCARSEERLFLLPEGARGYLSAINTLSPGAVRALPLAEEDYAALRSLLFFLAERMVGGTLKTIETGAGIL